VNPINTTLAFDVVLTGYGTGTNQVLRFQNNIQSIFSRCRIMYGSTPLEDIINYNQIVRNLTEWTATNQNNTVDQMSISEGVGGYVFGPVGNNSANGAINVRQRYIQGFDATATTGFGSVPNNTTASVGTTGTTTRRYQVNLACGLLTQDKLLPVKFMASQLAIELTLEQAVGCLFARVVGTGTDPTYSVNNVTLIPEILEFDASYDAMFLRGLQEGGVPIKFSSWHTFQFSTTTSTSVNLQVQERSRSVKALFHCTTKSPATLITDSNATLNATTTSTFMTSYQYRIGGRYFPAAPVSGICGTASTASNGGGEAFIELQKALNVVADYRLSSSVNNIRWCQPSVTSMALAEMDYGHDVGLFSAVIGTCTTASVTAPYCSTIGPACYTAAIDLETSNGVEISGLNAEEQSDISFIASWSAAQAADGYVMTVFTYYDAMLILRENNVLELIQ